MKDQDAHMEEENEQEIASQRPDESLLCSEELFDKQLRVIVEDTIHGNI